MDPNNSNKPTDHPVPTTPETSKKVKCDKTYQNRRKSGGNAGPSNKAKNKNNNTGGAKRGKTTQKRDRPAQSPSGHTPVNKSSKSTPNVGNDKKIDGRNADKNNTVSTPQTEGFWSLLRLVIRHWLRGVAGQDRELQPDIISHCLKIQR
jgi:hypothetical protein